MNKKQFGDRVRIARQRKDMSQLDLAVALEEYGVKLNQTAIGKIERGERNMYVHQLLAFVEVLEVPVAWLLYGGDIRVP